MPLRSQYFQFNKKFQQQIGIIKISDLFKNNVIFKICFLPRKYLLKYSRDLNQ